MAYAITPPAHLIATAQGRKFAVWASLDSGMITFAAFEYKADGWGNIWTLPLNDGDWYAAEFAKMGGIRQWMASVSSKVNTYFRTLFSGTVAPATTGVTAFNDLLNELNANWKLTVGADGVPVFGPK